MEAYNILGLMSGSSCDGVDVALCKFWTSDQDIQYELEDTCTFAFPTDIKESLSQAAQLSNTKLKILETRFSRFLASNINAYLGESKSVDYIASHGHTVLHDPASSYTVQIGAGSLIAAETNLATICDFRSLDMAYGGQGAPIAPIADKYLFPGHTFYLNLGGIVNISCNANSKFIGYDIAPCNQMLNALSKTKGLEYDEGGKIASAGMINDDLLQKLLSHSYLQQGYPKSLDNSWVRDNYTTPILDYDDSIENRLHTSVEFMAQAISDELNKIATNEQLKLKGATMFCTGGGAFNEYLIKRLAFHCEQHSVKLVIPEAQIIEYKEAMLMALMGYLRITNQPNCMSSVTGASKDCSGGVIHYP